MSESRITAVAEPATAANMSNPTSPERPITASSIRADVAVTRLGDAVHLLLVDRIVKVSPLEAVELLRALTAALPSCGYCGQPCEVDYCTDRDCRRLDAACESAWRDGFESHPVGFTAVGKQAA